MSSDNDEVEVSPKRERKYSSSSTDSEYVDLEADSFDNLDEYEHNPSRLHRKMSQQTFVPISEREAWKDVVPIEQDDGPNPIVAIAYSAKFKETHDYFRAIVKAKEKSERALNLTAECIWLNAANYTVWQYRRDILKELGIDLKDELIFIEVMIRCNFKNYQVWHHRKVIIEWMNDPSEELEFTAAILEKDDKNYHAWQHRQWAISFFNLFDNELEYAEHLIEKDIRNNSAWNQRYYVVSNTTKFESDVLEREVNYALDKILEAPSNESSWNYLRGIMMHDKDGGMGYNRSILKKCEELYNNNCRSPHLLSCIIDISQERISCNEPKDSLFHTDKALELCTDLEEKYDKIRKKYWKYISQKISEKVKSTA
ncbi:protein farnesyltransferase/geranylgeranyltransferase type-1 subunit alpha [Trichogramma pretiosum]|uniref:protein farnesyltransferase/geranylgeranyltransferase type-1 subunit alpha n=1 Tax=Trichogramma pretiosum TaxID=7493 RepID=UPI0006C9BF10|nr:protein farnesyltransferase/geranylgeranyltransferase type-1 subunit alpha [Trichogramma pretiosum]